jgi:hypothetical protein
MAALSSTQQTTESTTASTSSFVATPSSSTTSSNAKEVGGSSSSLSSLSSTGDLFDALLNIESDFIAEGAARGERDGLRQGFFEGRTMVCMHVAVMLHSISSMAVHWLVDLVNE